MFRYHGSSCCENSRDLDVSLRTLRRIAPYTGRLKTIRFEMANGLDLTTITSVLSVTAFIIGILLGVTIKRAIKLALAIVALVRLLAVTGYLNLAWSMPSANTIYYVFNGAQPVASQAIGLTSLLPISSEIGRARVGKECRS